MGDRRELVRVLTALDESECQSVLDEARGQDKIPLSHLVIEGWANSIDQLVALVAKLPAAVVVLDDIGRRCITRESARLLRAELTARQAAERERAARRQAELAANNPTNATRARVRALQQAQKDGWLPDRYEP